MTSDTQLLPRTSAGRLAVALCALAFLSVAITIAADADASIGPLNVGGAISFALFIGAGVTALYASVRRQDRAPIVLVPVAIGALIAAFEIVEAMF